MMIIQCLYHVEIRLFFFLTKWKLFLQSLIGPKWNKQGDLCWIGYTKISISFTLD